MRRINRSFVLDSLRERDSLPPFLPAQLSALFTPRGLSTEQQASTCAGVSNLWSSPREKGVALRHKVSDSPHLVSVIHCAQWLDIKGEKMFGAFTEICNYTEHYD